jgi:glucose-6-phosphate dehydrogenase assembly protein OpcA
MCDRVGSAVEALCVPEIPTSVVWLGRVHVDDPVFLSVAENAQRIILDTDYTSLSSLLHLARWAREAPGRPRFADLAWTRISTWQELCARFFDEPRLREHAMKVTRLSVRQAGDAGSRLGSEGSLLIGWLATRLGWKTSRMGGTLRFKRPDGGTVNLQLGTVKRPAQVAPGALAGVEIEAESGDLRLSGAIDRDLGWGAASPTRRRTPTSSHGASRWRKHRPSSSASASGRTRGQGCSSGRSTGPRSIRRSRRPSCSPRRCSRTGCFAADEGDA